MKKYIVIILLIFGLNVKTYPQQNNGFYEQADSLNVGYGIAFSKAKSAFSSQSIQVERLGNVPHIDVGKALYGRIAGQMFIKEPGLRLKISQY